MSQHITEADLAKRFDMTVRTLQAWRKNGTGPAFIRIGERSILYRMDDVLAYEESCLVGKVEAWRAPVKRAAGVLSMLAGQAKTPKARETISNIRDELRALLV